MDDFLGLKVLWPKKGEQLARHEHDIVLVHGLHSGPVSDWQDGNDNDDDDDDDKEVFWPVELLAQDLGNARILSFGYEQGGATVRSDDAYQEGSVFNHGEALCLDLKDNRTLLKGQPPPITFVGHGTGGIVIKSALSYSHARKSQFGSILSKTKHVIFLDTPHAGLNQQAWSSISGGSFSERSIGQWKLWSTILSDLRKTFAEIAIGFNITSSCASLTDRPMGFRDEVVPGDSGLTHLPHEHNLILDGVTHLTICKFSERDTNYERLLARIRAGRVCFTKDEEHIQRIRSWIGRGVEGQSESAVLNISDHDECLERRHPGTCEWLFEDPVFREWAYQHDSRSFLWLTAPGGTGKSVLCSVAAEQIAELESRPATPYIMISYRKERSKCQIATLLASQLLDHVLAQHGGVDTEVLSLLVQSATSVENVHSLVRLLVSQCSAVYFFLDGLNEIQLSGAAASERRREELSRLGADLHATLRFLSGLADGDTGTRVRIWCSSQKTSPVMEWMDELCHVELPVDEGVVEQDVRSYLIQTTQKILTKLSDPIDQLKVAARLRYQADSNFRWAYMMEESLRKCPTARLLVEAVERGLPNTLRETYAERLDELIRLDAADEADGNPPLSINLLSLLAFTRRPLKLSEVQEALSVVEYALQEGGGCKNLTPDSLIQRKNIMHRCAPLVEFVPVSRGSDDGYMQLSHGSVFEFLRESPHNGKADNDKPMRRAPGTTIDPNIIADACLKYISQQRYSSLLQKLSTTDFRTGSGRDPQDVRKHYFLQYAAKYWYRHLEEVGDGRYEDVKLFILSRQFLTVIQVQSLFVIGHFINSFDNTDRRTRLMKRNLPEWFREREEGRGIAGDYECFLVEWSRFLQLGISTCMNGELQRCLWGALGRRNFLHGLGSEIESNKSFLLESVRDPGADGQASCFYETISSDGTRLTVWSVVSDSPASPACAPPSHILLKRNVWYIDGDRPPFEYGPVETLSFDRDLVGWELFDPCRTRVIPLVPSTDSSARVCPVADCKYGAGVRIGSVEFTRQKGGSWTSVHRRQGTGPLPYWEDIVFQGQYICRSRRKLIDLEDETTTANKSRKRRRAVLAQQAVAPQFDEEDGDDDLQDDSDQGIREVLDGAVSSAEEYYSGSSSNSAGSGGRNTASSEDATDDEEPRTGREGSDGSLVLSDSESEGDAGSSTAGSSSEPRSQSESRSRRESVSSISSAKLSEDEDHPNYSDADDESSDAGSWGDQESVVSPEAFAFGQPRISAREIGVQLSCDTCSAFVTCLEAGTRGETFFRCTLCNGNDSFDICTLCFDKGAWCNNKNHQLRKMTYRRHRFRTLERLSWCDAKPVVHITVERRGQDDTRDAIFRYTTRDAGVLYGSPPLLHPVLPLLIYPLDGCRFLFANLRENTYFLYSIPLDDTETGGRTCTPISVSLRLSLCGYYLHVARVTARKPTIAAAAASSTPTRLFLQVLTVALCPKSPCSRRPRILAPRRGIALGNWQCTDVAQLPFSLTWTYTDVYVSLSAELLRVFKIPLYVPKETARNPTAAEEETCTLEKDVVLPRSARSRTVSFFPAKHTKAAKVILGAVYGDRPEPPAVVYLRPGSVGEWVPAKEAVLSFLEMPQTRNDPLLEDFDADSDCDLSIPLIDFQR